MDRQQRRGGRPLLLHNRSFVEAPAAATSRLAAGSAPGQPLIQAATPPRGGGWHPMRLWFMRRSKLEMMFCPTCGRDEHVEVTFDVAPLLGGGTDWTAIDTTCRIGHPIKV